MVFNIAPLNLQRFLRDGCATDRWTMNETRKF